MDAVHEVLARSALVSLSATAIAVVLGVPVGTWLALGRRRGRGVFATAVNTGMAVPTVVVGLLVALALWRSGPLGNLGLIYTLRGMIIAQVLIAAPLIAGITMAGLQALPAELPDQLRALSANTPQLVWRLWIEARVPLLAAAMAGFGHAISEVGAATIVGGNIHGQTQVDDHMDRRAGRQGRLQRALVARRSCSRSPSRSTRYSRSSSGRAAAWAQWLACAPSATAVAGVRCSRSDPQLDLEKNENGSSGARTPNGTGKTTLLRLLAGLDARHAGLVAGVERRADAPDADLELRRGWRRVRDAATRSARRERGPQRRAAIALARHRCGRAGEPPPSRLSNAWTCRPSRTRKALSLSGEKRSASTSHAPWRSDPSSAAPRQSPLPVSTPEGAPRLLR